MKRNISRLQLIIYIIVSFSLILTLFLTTSLISFYFKKVRHYQKGDLIYEFKQNTLTNNHQNLGDIREQYLSYGISYGIDVSEWQGEIDWQKVASTGISFAIIRCGFRETLGSNIKEDEYFRKNIEGAEAAGLNVGVYFYGVAKTKEEALEEADFTYNLIKDYNLTYPVVYDVEAFHNSRLENIDYGTLSDNVLVFTETLADYGYQTMVYTYKLAMTNILDMGKFEGKLIWLAHYVDETDYKGNYHMWQYSDAGKVDGINTYVDLNISYFEYVSDEKEIVVNPMYVSDPEVAFKEVSEEVKVIETTKFRTSPTKDIPNTLGTIKRGEILKRIGISEYFSKVIYNDRVVYIENEKLKSI